MSRTNHHTRTDPFKLPQFWVDEMTARLANPYLTDHTRKRYERLRASERKKLQTLLDGRAT